MYKVFIINQKIQFYLFIKNEFNYDINKLYNVNYDILKCMYLYYYKLKLF